MIADLDVWIRDNCRPVPPPTAAGDADDLTGCRLEDFGAEWAERLRIPSATFARRDGEPDPVYRPRLVEIIRAARARRLS